MSTSTKAFPQGFSVKGQVCVVTGGSSGIGKAYCVAFAKAGAKAVVVADINEAEGQEVVDEIKQHTKAVFIHCDVSKKAPIENLIKQTIDKFGSVDLFAANAGIAKPREGIQNFNEASFKQMFDINVMHILRSAHLLVPSWLERGRGCFVITASSAGLLGQIDGVNYGVSKFAAVSVADFMAINYGTRGINTVVFCPQAVASKMTMRDGKPLQNVATLDGVLPASFAAEKVLSAIQEGRYLVMEPEEQLNTYIRRKTGDYNRWITGMQRLRARLEKADDNPNWTPMSKI